MKVAIPRAYLGTMTFAWSSQTSSTVDEAVALEMAQRFVKFNDQQQQQQDVVHRIDTARVYAGGKTEPVVGAVLRGLEDHTTAKTTISVGTKAHPSVGAAGLSESGMVSQLAASLDAMQLTSVGEYYLHQPDTEHSLLESLKCARSLVQQGKIETIGMSNYHAKEMERAFQLCKEHQLTPPKVYQGLYNPLNRKVEAELLPVLRENGCSFVAYNPLAAGLLTGKHTSLKEVAAGRFQNNENYLPRFYTEANFQAIQPIREQCDKDGISMVEATYRWLLRHSALGDTDGFLLGASSLEQLDQNLEACSAATIQDNVLSEDMLATFDKAWELTESGAFPYWRSYSADMPNRETMDQGASYNAQKAK